MMKSPRPLEVVVKLVVVELVSPFTGLLLVKVFVAKVPWSTSAQRILLDEMGQAVHTIRREYSRRARKSQNGVP